MCRRVTDADFSMGILHELLENKEHCDIGIFNTLFALRVNPNKADGEALLPTRYCESLSRRCCAEAFFRAIAAFHDKNFERSSPLTLCHDKVRAHSHDRFES